jgi:hypothetical protein
MIGELMDKEIEKILDGDNLKEILNEVLEANPDTLVLAWYDREKGESKYQWYGGYPTALGLSYLLKENIEVEDMEQA